MVGQKETENITGLIIHNPKNCPYQNYQKGLIRSKKNDKYLHIFAGFFIEKL